MRATKRRNQQKLAQARELLADHRSQLSAPLAAIESRPAEVTWPAPTEPARDQTGTQWQLLPRSGLTPDLPVPPSYPPSAELPITTDPAFANPLPADPAATLIPSLPVDPAFTTTSGLATIPAATYGANLPTDPATMLARPCRPRLHTRTQPSPSPRVRGEPVGRPGRRTRPGLPVDPAFTPSHGMPVNPAAAYTAGLPTTPAPAFAANPPTAPAFAPAQGLPTTRPPRTPPAHRPTRPSRPPPPSPPRRRPRTPQRRPSPRPPPPPAPIPAGQAADAGYDLKAAKVVAFARAQIGRPCVWGAAGPGSYDAAGLTQASWKSAGVALPRTSQGQTTVPTAVSLAEVRVGDLIFFFDDLSHVGLFVGNGMMIHAPGPGAYIREESVFHAGESAIRGAVRPS